MAHADDRPTPAGRGADVPPDGRDLVRKPPPDPLWPSESTSQGQFLRLSAGLSSPGNPARAKRLGLAFVAGVVVFVLVVVAFAIAG